LDKDGVMRFRQSGFGEGTAAELSDAIHKALQRASDPNLAAVVASTKKEVSPANNADSSGVDRVVSDSDSSRTKSSDVETSPAFSGIEGDQVSGVTYKNEALSLAYEFPRGWIAAKPDVLHALNEILEAGTKASLQQHPEAAGNLRIIAPRLVFYASRRGDGDGQHLSFPCVRIMATPSRATALQVDTFRQATDAMVNASGSTVASASAEYRVKDHPFLRADFERSMGGQRIFQTYVQTLSEDYSLTIEIYALSSDDKAVAIDSLQKIVIDE
jgi:hypothetical protein